MSFPAGDVSGSVVLTDNDHLYASHINSLRVSRATSAVVGRDINCEYACDGTNDHVQIQEAIDAVSASGGGNVFLAGDNFNLGIISTAGTRHSSSSSYYSINLKSNVHLIGAGIGATILNGPAIPDSASGGYNTMIVNLDDLEYTSIENMSLINPAFTLGPGGVPYRINGGFTFKGCKHAYFQNIYGENGCGIGLLGYTYSWDNTEKKLITDTYDVLYDNCTFNKGVGSSTLAYVRDITLRHCTEYDWQDDPLLIAGLAQQINIDNFLYDQLTDDMLGGATACIYIINDEGGTDIRRVSNIKITHSTLRNFYINSGDQYGISIAHASNIEIDDVTIEKCGGGIEDAGGTRWENVTIKNCHIFENRGHGIYKPSAAGMTCKNSSLIDNEIWNNSGRGVTIDSAIAGSTIDGLTMNGNKVYDNQDTPTQSYGILVYNNNATGNVVNTTAIGNTCYGNTTQNFAITASNVFTGNMRNNKGAPPTMEIEQEYMQNTSGGDLTKGSVVVLKSVAGGNEFTTTTSQGDDKVYGVLAEDIANNAYGMVQTLGKTIHLKADGTTDIAVGDLLGTFTSAGIAMKAAAGDMAFAIALEAYATNDSNGVIEALIIKPRKL